MARGSQQPVLETLNVEPITQSRAPRGPRVVPFTIIWAAHFLHGTGPQPQGW